MKKLLIFAILLRLILIPLFYHGDIGINAYFSNAILEGHTNIYDYFRQEFSIGRSILSYPPIYYFLNALLIAPIKYLHICNLPDLFYVWEIPQLTMFLIQSTPSFLTLFLLKFPLLLADIATGFLIYRITGKEKALLLWLYCPIPIFATYLVGQFDILPTFFTAYALYCAKEYLKRSLSRYDIFSMFLLGLGASLKHYPLLLIPIFSPALSKSPKKIILLTVIGFLPYILSILPFINSPAFFEQVLQNEKTLGVLSIKLEAFGIPLYPFFFLYALIFFSNLLTLEKTPNSLFTHSFACASLLCLTDWNPQWLVFIAPFLVVAASSTPLDIPYILATAIFSLRSVLIGNISIATLMHISPIFAKMPTLTGLLYPYIPLINISLLLAFLLLTLLLLFPKFKTRMDEKILILMPLLFLLLVISLSFFYSTLASAYGGIYDVYQPVYHDSKPASSVEQSFFSHYSNLSEIRLYLFGEGEAELSLLSGSNRIASSKTSVRNYSIYTLYFPKIEDSKDREFVMRINSTGNVSLLYSKEDRYPLGEMEGGGDLGFFTRSRPPLTELITSIFSSLRDRLEAEFLFFVSYMLLALLIYLKKPIVANLLFTEKA
ncbi:MAG: hypothetical protein QXP42_05085 [Candidatus Micrarchaeia archaeon]